MNDFDYLKASADYESQCNDAKPEPSARCDKCGHPLYEGDTIYRIGDDIFCENCCERTWL